MITISEYAKPTSVGEAYELLTSRKDSVLIGGGAFLRLGSRHIGLAIDLSKAGMEYINEKAETIEIGGMTTFRAMETSELLREYYDNLFARSVEGLVGVQLRNLVTIGATVYSKYGFSDPITALLALNCKVVLHQAGEMPLAEFLTKTKKEKDILEKIIVKKESLLGSFQMMRNSQGDYALLNVAATKQGDKFFIAVGARPGVAAFALKAMEFANANSLDEKAAEKVGQLAAEEMAFSSNNLASAEYRKHLCKVLVKRAVLEVAK